MTDTVYNLFLYVKGQLITQLGIVAHELKGTDQEKVTQLQMLVEADYRVAKRLDMKERFEWGRYEGLTRLGRQLHMFEPLFQECGAPINPLVVITPIVDEHPRIDAVTGLGALNLNDFKGTLLEEPGEMADYLKAFESGFRNAFSALWEKMDPRFPLTVYYAFKQDDESSVSDGETDEGTGVDLTTGWETLLEALMSSGFQITATWPVRASQKWRMVSMGTNALASYIVLACRPRLADAPQTDRRSFVIELKHDLPGALRHLQQGNIAPVDFAQAAIGPGMAIYSRYSRILESSGNPMTVRAALSLINQTLTEVLSELEDEFDADTRWAIPWFEQNGFSDGEFGDAELLSKAKVTSVAALQNAHIIHSKAGQVRLLRPEELSPKWNPTSEKRVTVWEMTHHLLRVYFHEKAGDLATAEVLVKLGSDSELARDLAYQLFHVCEKKKLTQEALAYNALVLGWPEISRLARQGKGTSKSQPELFERG
jgi:putative DNA methylase